MDTGHYLKARVSPELKRSVQQAAEQQQITQSIWVRRALLDALRQHPEVLSPPASSRSRSHRNTRLSVRLRVDDQRLLQARAAARSLAPATYVSLLVRSHLNGVAPLPQAELEAFRTSLRDLAITRRYVHSLAQVATKNGRLTGPHSQEVIGMIKVLKATHDRFKALLAANLKSWETGDGE